MGRGKKYQPEQVVNLLRQIEVAIADGKTTALACKEAGIVEQTYFRWRKEYGGLQVDQAKRLKELEQENSKLKRLVANLSLDNLVLKDFASGKHRARLVIANLDRLARNVAFISNLMESGFEFVAVEMPQANRFVVHILAAVAEQEAEAISKRTTAALAATKARGTKLGVRRVSAERFAEIGAAARQVRSQNASKIRSELLPTITAIQATGASSLRAIAAELNACEIPTPRRLGEWSAVQVKRMMERSMVLV